MKTYKFAAHIDANNPQEVREYLQVFFETEGMEGFIDALGHIAKKQGMSKVADIAGINRQNLYRALRKGAHPNFMTVNKVVAALGCHLEVIPNSINKDAI
ncbi:Addiction module antidote protein [uncultured Candidatus Thioglobus sp.]|nr:Addiction module antidote protein [uncultured Candidatus Thioglobus sp.]